MGRIEKDNPNRWVLVQSNAGGETGIIVFGNIGPINETELETGEPNLDSYFTETELQTEVNTISGIPDYYEDSVDAMSEKFLLPSGIYPI